MEIIVTTIKQIDYPCRYQCDWLSAFSESLCSIVNGGRKRSSVCRNGIICLL